MVVALLVVVAVVGATAVYLAGEAQHRRDRRDVVRWEHDGLPAARDAETLQRALRPTMISTEIAAGRGRLEQDARAIVGAAGPEVVRPAAAAWLEAIKKTEASLMAVGTPSFSGQQTRATAAFEVAESAEHTLVCRARLPGCSGP
jgi:hypothetical protein